MNMNLTDDDLGAIRENVKNEVSVVVRNSVKEEIEPLRGDIEALTNDIKEIYAMIANLEKKTKTDLNFDKLSLEKKIIHFHNEIVAVAKQAGITLPSH